jgi:hypothetical protein
MLSCIGSCLGSASERCLSVPDIGIGAGQNPHRNAPRRRSAVDPKSRVRRAGIATTTPLRPRSGPALETGSARR